MAFTGTPAIKRISDNQIRITGLSLANAAAGTIGLVGGAGEIDLAGLNWNEYATKGSYSGQVGLQESVSCEIIYADAAATTTEPISVVAAGNDVENFLLTLTNRDAAASGALVIILRFHG